MISSRSMAARAAIATLACAALSALWLPAAHAAPVAASRTVAAVAPASIKVSSSAIKKMRATWKAYGVSTKTQDKLIAKLKAGKAWDALKKSKAKKVKKYTKSGFTTRVYTYADGSIRVSQMQQPQTPISAFGRGLHSTATARCTVTQTHYSYVATGCIASDNVVLIVARMTIDYGAMAGSGNAQISRAYDSYVFSVLGTADAKDPYKVSNTEYHMVFSISLGFVTAPQILTVKSVSPLTVEARANA